MENNQKNNYQQHGMRSHKLYSKWKAMLYRCENINHISYKNYGGRGITVCDRWKHINNFIEDMYPTYQHGLSIDRINNDGNYELSNCRWATKETQAQNTRKIRSNNTSGYRGVHFDKDTNKWRARIEVDYKHKHLGLFSSAIEAAIAYDQYIIDNKLEHTINGLSTI